MAICHQVKSVKLRNCCQICLFTIHFTFSAITHTTLRHTKQNNSMYKHKTGKNVQKPVKTYQQLNMTWESRLKFSSVTFRLDNWTPTISKARFPLPELTGDQFPLPVNTARVDGCAFPLAELTVDGPSTRLVETRARQHGPC